MNFVGLSFGCLKNVLLEKGETISGCQKGRRIIVTEKANFYRKYKGEYYELFEMNKQIPALYAQTYDPILSSHPS